MDAKTWQVAKQWVAKVADLPASELDAYLARHCPDPALRQEVLAMLADPLSISRILPSATLQPGETIGPYEIVEPIGAGGMGEVYRAKDRALGRDVAIKVLPMLFAQDRERLARFDREARLLASINHPAIAHVYGAEAWQSSRAIVMELVPGPTLADRIAQGALPLAEALPLARQIAEALATAHDQGIVHRDLKPANIKASESGIVKVLDFGLAKALLEEPLASEASTVVSPAVTAQGVILGTAAYMSPEQARGKAIDKRTDVWAFGCVVYEMLTGSRAFPGESVLDTATSVLKQEPDWSRLPVGTPAPIRALLRRCLVKDRTKRLADLHDAALAIDDVIGGVDQAPERVPMASRRSVASGWIVAAAAIAIAGALGWMRWRTADPASQTFDIATPLTSDQTMFALSPEGRRLVYLAYSGSEPVLWLRDFHGVGVAMPIAGTAGAGFPFWSPDGESIGFFANGQLKRIDLGSGTVRDLAAAPNARGGTWSNYAGGTILYSTGVGIWRVPSAGGTSLQVTKLQDGQSSHRYPQFLQDGHRFFYGAQGNRAGEEAAPGGLFLMDLDGGRTERLADGRSQTLQLSENRVMFLRQNVGLVVQSTQADGWQLVGAPLPAVPDVRPGLYGGGAFSWRPGILAYRRQPSFEGQLQWFDAHGSPMAEASSPGVKINSGVALSPDGHRVAITRGDDVVTIDMQTGRETRLAPGFSKIWSTDGRTIFVGGPGGIISQKTVDSDDAETQVFTRDTSINPVDVSDDGRLLVAVFTDQGGWDLWIHPLHGGDDVPIARSPAQEFQGQFRPGGEWIAYVSTESGRSEIWLKRLDEKKSGKQVSTHGGVMPRWSADGTQLFFLSLDADMTAVPVDVHGSTVTFGVEKKLFRAPVNLETFRGVGVTASYDVARDGRFLINVDRTEPQPITIVTNWKPPAK